MSKVAVIIVNFNSGDLLARCLSALLLMNRQPDEIVVVDNASDDDSLACISEIAFPVKLLLQEDNLGFAAANNLAVETLIDCEWVALLNPDAFPEKDWLDVLLSASQRYPQADFFASRMMQDGGSSLLDGAGDTYHCSGLAWRRGYNNNLTASCLREREVFSPCAGAGLYRLASFRQAGGFDERFFCYMEDVDLGYRLRLLGKSCIYIPDAVVTHIGSAVTGKISGFSAYHGHRNLVWTFVKNTPASLMLLLLPCHLLMSLVVLLSMFKRGQARVYLKAKFDAVRGLSEVVADRKVIQRQRTLSSWRLLKMFDYSVFSRG